MYSTQVTGATARLLHTDPARASSEAVTTLASPELAERLARVLNVERECAFGGEDLAPRPGLVVDAERVGPVPAQLRRRALAAFDHGAPPDALHAETFAARVSELLSGESEAVRRAVRDELGRLYAGLDDVLVVATLSAYRAPVSHVIVNAVLDAVPDDVLAELLEPGTGDPGAPYFIQDAFADEIAPTLDGHTPDEVDLELNEPAYRAWLAAHRPHLLDR